LLKHELQANIQYLFSQVNEYSFRIPSYTIDTLANSTKAINYTIIMRTMISSVGSIGATSKRTPIRNHNSINHLALLPATYRNYNWGMVR
jgi:hypothetical protein